MFTHDVLHQTLVIFLTRVSEFDADGEARFPELALIDHATDHVHGIICRLEYAVDGSRDDPVFGPNSGQQFRESRVQR